MGRLKLPFAEYSAGVFFDRLSGTRRRASGALAWPGSHKSPPHVTGSHKRARRAEACDESEGGTPGSKYAGGHRIRVTPVPIPNTEVKPDTADGTAWETVWESRSLPAVLRTRTPRKGRFRLYDSQRPLRHTVPHAVPSAAKPPRPARSASGQKQRCMGNCVGGE